MSHWCPDCILVWSQATLLSYHWKHGVAYHWCFPHLNLAYQALNMSYTRKVKVPSLAVAYSSLIVAKIMYMFPSFAKNVIRHLHAMLSGYIVSLQVFAFQWNTHIKSCAEQNLYIEASTRLALRQCPLPRYLQLSMIMKEISKGYNFSNQEGSWSTIVLHWSTIMFSVSAHCPDTFSSQW